MLFFASSLAQRSREYPENATQPLSACPTEARAAPEDIRKRPSAMRLFILAIVLIGSVFTASATPRSYHAGVARFTVPDATTPFDTVIFYPSDTQEVDQ
jgi:hypothetical protein